MLNILLCLSFSGEVSTHGRIRFSGNQLIDDEGDNYTVHGVSLSWHNFAPQFYNANAIKQLVTKWKVTAIRAPIGVETIDALLQNPDLAFESVRNAIDSAIRNDIYVVVDWHSHHIRLPEAIEFFQKVAKLYKGYNNLIYEIFNEPDDSLYTWEDVRSYSAEVISKIREVDPNSLILVGSPDFDLDIDLVSEFPITGFTNVGYTVHFYAGTQRQELRDKVSDALVKGIPIFVSECGGMEDSGNGDIDVEEFRAWLSFLDKNSISWIVWSVSAGSNQSDMLKPGTDAYEVWDDSSLTDWGSLVKQTLAGYTSL